VTVATLENSLTMETCPRHTITINEIHLSITVR
jgi:hypothetical protein